MTVHKASTITLEPPITRILLYGSIPSVTERGRLGVSDMKKGHPLKEYPLNRFLWSDEIV